LVGHNVRSCHEPLRPNCRLNKKKPSKKKGTVRVGVLAKSLSMLLSTIWLSPLLFILKKKKFLLKMFNDASGISNVVGQPSQHSEGRGTV
jgi:hypothetical protein